MPGAPEDFNEPGAPLVEGPPRPVAAGLVLGARPEQAGALRQDLLALWGGIVLSAAFTGAIWWAGGRLAAVPHLPDTGVDWYYWRLPDPGFWNRATAWGLYALHQAAIWGVLYYAQQRRQRGYTTGLWGTNVAALGLNLLFVALHFVQTHVWYSGLAEDVSIFASQGSVVLLLVLVLLMENRRRGLFFGRPAPIAVEVVQLVRRYHGYFFSWAAIFTFWYHPMEATSGHLVGFFYTFLLLLQGSLFYTRVHVNRWWTLAQEATVLVHGTLVAMMQGNTLWPMFAFGFGGVFVITQMHGLGWSRAWRSVVLALYVGLVLVVYAERGWGHLNEVLRIPLIDYALVFVLAWLMGGALWLRRRLAAHPKLARAGNSRAAA